MSAGLPSVASTVNDRFAFQHQLIDSYEANYLRLAQALHGGPLQELHGLDFGLAALAEQLAGRDEQAQVVQLRAILRDTVRTLRGFSHQLYPPTLIPFGLSATLRSSLEELQKTHPTLVLHAQLAKDEVAVPLPLRLALFRVYQSTIDNVVCHASAQNIWVELRVEADKVMLQIVDDGCGFVGPAAWADFAQQGKLGLLKAMERTAAIQGIFTIDSAPGEGTKVQVTAPLSSSDDQIG